MKSTEPNSSLGIFYPCYLERPDYENKPVSLKKEFRHMEYKEEGGTVNANSALIYVPRLETCS